MGKCLQNGTWSAELLLLAINDADFEEMTEEENDFVVGVVSLAEVENDTIAGEHDIQLAEEWDEWLDAREIGYANVIHGISEDNDDGSVQEHEVQEHESFQQLLPPSELGVLHDVEAVSVSEAEHESESEPMSEVGTQTYAIWLNDQAQETEDERALFFRNFEYDSEEARLERGRELARVRHASRVARMLRDEE